MKYIYLCLIVFLLSCSNGLRLKGAYQEGPSLFNSSKSFDESWDSAIDLLAAKGFDVKTIDKSSGIIISESYSFLNSYTRENPDGELIDPSAYVVTGTVRNGFGMVFPPTIITGNWNIRIKRAETGSNISINLVNLTCKYTSRETGTYDIPIKSTGVFEKYLISELK